VVKPTDVRGGLAGVCTHRHFRCLDEWKESVLEPVSSLRNQSMANICKRERPPVYTCGASTTGAGTILVVRALC
jgi:hypothetical protein